MNLIQSFKNFINDEEGVTAIEYGLIAALVSIVIITALTAIGGGVEKIFEKIQKAIEGVSA